MAATNSGDGSRAHRPYLGARRTALSQITENRKVWARKSLIFQYTVSGFCLEKAILRQSPRQTMADVADTTRQTTAAMADTIQQTLADTSARIRQPVAATTADTPAPRRRSGRPSGPLRQQILAVLQAHPDG